MEDAKWLDAAAADTASRLGYVDCTFVAHGAFKRTYRVTAANDDVLALKLYARGAGGAREQREIEALAALTECGHANIVRLSADGHVDFEGERVRYSVEEFLDGGSLEEANREAPLNRSAILRIGRGLIAALAHTRSLGLVHRDIKPANIMLRDDGSPVLVDFGLVRNLLMTSLTQTFMNQGPGTPMFASPEQLKNEKELIDWRSDQVSLAVTLAMSSNFGRHPFGRVGEAIHTTLQDRVVGKVGPDAGFVDWAQEQDLEPLVRMLGPWPVERFATPMQLSNCWGQLTEGAA